VSTDVIVVGGGIAGLATAYELTRRDVPFLLIDRAPALGGVIRSEPVDGLTIDAGPDALLVQKPDAIKLCHELGLGDRLVSTKPPRLAYIQRGGRLHPLPAASVLGIPTRVGPFLRTRLFSWRGKLRMGAELFVPPRRDGADESIGAFMTRRFGAEAAAYLPRFADAELKYGSLIRAFRRRPSAPPSSDGAFKSLPGGLSELVAALAAHLPAAAVRSGTAAVRVTGTGPYRVETSHGVEDAHAVVLAAPAYVNASLAAELDPAFAAWSAEVPYTSIATVALAFPRASVAHPLNGSGYVVPRAEGNGILAASWLSSKWPNRAPEDTALIRTFIGGARDPDALADADDALVARSLAAIRPILGIAGNPTLTRVYRFPRASAQHEVGHLERLARIERALAEHPGLFVTGSGYRGVGIPDCVADARATAARAAEWLAGRHATVATEEARRAR
jgi:oxygen-dependent protoporphyrinogen oxidase